ncbi:MAG TPA: hypothetical protein VFM55_09840 [Micromonosporaceae bacterium]|nr:hypothetical protein [Micromonosporaceae bacterium]
MYLALHHDGPSWVIVDQDGAVVARNGSIPSDDGQGAYAWGHTVVATIPGETVPLETSYVDGGKAKPCSAVFHDGQRWVMTDGRGVVVAHTDEIPEDGDYTVWTDRILRFATGSG